MKMTPWGNLIWLHISIYRFLKKYDETFTVIRNVWIESNEYEATLPAGVVFYQETCAQMKCGLGSIYLQEGRIKK